MISGKNQKGTVALILFAGKRRTVYILKINKISLSNCSNTLNFNPKFKLCHRKYSSTEKSMLWLQAQIVSFPSMGFKGTLGLDICLA